MAQSTDISKIENLKALLDKVVHDPHIPNAEKEKVYQLLNKTASLDYELRNFLELHRQGISDYKELLSDLRPDDVILCYAKSDIFVKYVQTQIDTIMMGDVSQFNKRTDVMQVVLHKAKQKFLIIYETSGDLNKHMPEILKLRKYVIDFFNSKMEHKIDDNAVILHSDKQNNCIIIVNVVVNSRAEKYGILSELMEYIMKCEKSTVLTKKISNDRQFHAGDDYNLYEVNFQGAGASKDLLGRSVSNEELLINLAKNYPMCNITINIDNSVTNNITNNGEVHGNITTGNHVTVKQKINMVGAQLFTDHIKRSKPLWYKENGWVERTFLKSQYERVTKSPVSDVAFKKIIEDTVGSDCDRKTIDGMRKRMVKLRPIADL